MEGLYNQGQGGGMKSDLKHPGVFKMKVTNLKFPGGLRNQNC